MSTLPIIAKSLSLFMVFGLSLAIGLNRDDYFQGRNSYDSFREFLAFCLTILILVLQSRV